MNNYDALVTRLREIFQIDRPELDFGIYRILNARADEIDAYLSTRLRERVSEALTEGASATAEGQQRELDALIASLAAAGVDPEGAPKVQELRAAIRAATTGASEHENAVFTHLLTFFGRYYDKGDFISQRRYKGDTYAIPYAGEEVVLHWANKDQYYTKSGEAFSNYAFALPDGRTVRFRLVAADTAKDNRKDTDKERRFVLADARTVARIDEDGAPYEDAVVPVAEDEGDLILRFDYRAMPKGSKQAALVDRAVETILGDPTVEARWRALAERAPTETNPQRTLLEKHLTNYTQKNTADYFIHKDLGGFLRRELDFYIKNEVMNLDDVQNARAFAAIETNLRMIQCLRAVALDLIAFLASIEDFQKKLWLKKKFVVAAQYCVTLDRVPAALYPAIAANPAQWAQWHDLGMRDAPAAGGVEDLAAQPFLMVDTALFEAAFRADLLRAIPDLDASTDGLLVHGDNFQALTLLTERYRGQVKCVYIDPPYNTGADGFTYKDGYKSSSWCAMIEALASAEQGLLSDENAKFVSCDENQLSELMKIAQAGRKLHGVFTWKRTRTGGHLSRSFNQLSDYVIVTTGASELRLFGGQADAEESQPLTKSSNSLKQLVFPSGTLKFLDLENGYIPNNAKGGVRTIGAINVEEYLNVSPVQLEGNFIWTQTKLVNELASGARIIVKRFKGLNPRFFRDPVGYKPFPSMADAGFVVGTNEDGSQLVNDMFGSEGEAISYPKPLELCRKIVSSKGFFDSNLIVLDYFAGSGTTGHAVLSLNRDDHKRRRYVMVEQGPYFDTVLKPRIQKVVYSADWRDGRPTAPGTGISHAFKVLKIESYEDTLNNLTLRRDRDQAGLLDAIGPAARDEYLMRYMLDVEARGSILSVEAFRKPFDHTLDIAVDSAGATAPTRIDLVETFNYLIGLAVRRMDVRRDQGYAAVEGTLPTGERTLVLWRDCDALDYDGLAALCDRLAIDPANGEYNVVYLNGDQTIPSVLQRDDADGGGERRLTLRQIEPAFLDAMFDTGPA